MTHEELGIDTETFAASLRVIGHPWRPGQRCNGFNFDGGSCSHPGAIESKYELPVLYDEKIGFSPQLHVRSVAHDIPIPAVTDELLMRMLREGSRRELFFLMEVHRRLLAECESWEAAIIRATAALEK